MAEAELPSLEERILTDDNFYQELLIAEDELIDQYLLDTLSESERNKFVSHFLITTERQDKLRFSQTFKRYLTAGRESEVFHDSPVLVSAGDKSTRKGWFGSFIPVTAGPTLSFDAVFRNRLILTTVSLLILVAVAVVLINKLSEQRTVGPEDLFVATLTPGLTRDGGDTTRIRIPPDKKVVRLELQLESLASSSQSGSPTDNYRSYTAELRTSENSTILRRDNLLAEVKSNRSEAIGNRSEAQGSRQVVNLDVPAEDLRSGDYNVRLSGVGASGATEPIGRYSFRIVD